ncbi:MAG: ABC transporter ATP-binding protein [Firmicutes bacterium]|nr:ABC transporter ATP-binding protein [Bacillota bacterium]
MVKTLLKYVGEYKKAAAITPLLIVGEVLMEILIPYVTAAIIDKGIEAGDFSQIVRYGAIMIACAFISLFFGVSAGRTAAKACTGFAANLRRGIYEKIQTFSFSNIDKFSTAGLITRMTTDVTNVQNAFQMIIRIAVRAPLMLVCSLVMCVIISPRLSMIFLAALLVLGCGLVFIMRKSMPVFNQMFARYDDLNASVQENVSGIRVVKAFNREEFENQKFGRAALRLYDLSVKAEAILALNRPIMMSVIYGCMLCLSWFGARHIVSGTLTTGNLTSLFSYVMSMMMSLMMLSMIFVMITMSLASARRISEVLNEEPALSDPEAPVTLVRDGSIDFDDVDFSYSSMSAEPVLKDIDIHIRSGETVGVIGATGSGKSSLVSLIPRLYDVSLGTVRVGGVDVRKYDMEALRNQVAVVLQKNVLFSGTILDNLRWGKEDATEEECREACRLAAADEFIERFPDGYETRVEQGGTNLSGGQRQRLCIARALLKDPKVLILDDSTSAVDTATDARIREAFRTVIPGTTKLIISQRISSVRDADRILVLDDGRVSGFGTHEELLATNEIYRDICEAQQASGGDFDEKQGGAL